MRYLDYGPIVKITDDEGNHHYGWQKDDREVIDGMTFRRSISRIKHHRLDGPAIEHANGLSSWYINDMPYEKRMDQYGRDAGLSDMDIMVLRLKYGGTCQF